MKNKIYACQHSKAITKHVLGGVVLQEKTVLFLLQELTNNTAPWRLSHEKRQELIQGLDVQHTIESELESLEEAGYSGPPPIHGVGHDEQFVYLRRIAYRHSSLRDEWRFPFLFENEYFIVYSPNGGEYRRSYLNTRGERIYPAEWEPSPHF